MCPESDSLECPSLLYKYVHPDRVDVLRNKRIRFTQPNALNDPFELKPFFRAAIGPEDARELFKHDADLIPAMKEAYAQCDRGVRRSLPFEEFKRRCFSALGSPEGKAMLAAVFDWSIDVVNAMTSEIQAGLHEAASERIGILSLSESPTVPPIWAHYADDHRGFLIEFASNSPFFNRRRSEKDEFYWLRKVNYRDAEPLPAMYGATGQDMLLSKRSDWSYEHEWRMLAPVEDADEVIPGSDNIYLFEFPPDCVHGLILGTRSSDALRSSLEQLCRSPDYAHCRLGRVRFAQSRAELELV